MIYKRLGTYSTILRVYTHRYSLKGKRSRIRHGNAQWGPYTHTHIFALPMLCPVHGVAASHTRVRRHTRRLMRACIRVRVYSTRVVILSQARDDGVCNILILWAYTNRKQSFIIAVAIIKSTCIYHK